MPPRRIVNEDETMIQGRQGPITLSVNICIYSVQLPFDLVTNRVSHHRERKDYRGLIFSTNPNDKIR